MQKDDLIAGLATILDADHIPLRQRTKGHAESVQGGFTKQLVHALLKTESLDTPDLAYCPSLEHLKLSGFTIDTHDAEHLLDLLALRQGDRKSVPTAECSGLLLTLTDCFTPDVSEPEDRASLDAKGMDYLQAQQFFRRLKHRLERT
jgi:hypothetical protein